MKRSNSSSHIPLARNDGRKRSNSLSRTSMKDRTPSLDRLQVPFASRVTGPFSIKKSTIGSAFSGGGAGKRSLTRTPILGSGIRKPSVTPSSSRSRSKSPNWPGAERSANNPKWVSQQYAKVVSFLQSNINCPEHIPKDIKPPTINTFVLVMNLLLKEINPRIEINTTNYKDIVLNTMKMLHYPGNISNSMMKTVNTMHTWPHIISMFSWLVDLINTIRRIENVTPELTENIRYQQIECVVQFVARRYLTYNNGNGETNSELDEEFGKTFASILNINEDEHEKLANEVAALLKRKEDRDKTLNSYQAKNDAITKETTKLQSEIDSFYLHKDEAQDDLDSRIALVQSRREKLVSKIQQKTEYIARLKGEIKQQPCTLQEKRRMIKRIDELKHTIELKREKIKTRKGINDEYEAKLLGANKEIETQVYRLDNALLKLTMYQPELKALQIKEKNFLTKQFGNTIKSVAENIEKFEAQYKQELETTRLELSKIMAEIASKKREVNAVKGNLEKLSEHQKSLNANIEMLSTEMETISNKRQQEKDEFLKKIKELKQSEACLQKTQQKYKETEALQRDTDAKFEERKSQFLEFFKKLQDEVLANLSNMTGIRNGIFDILRNYLKKIEDVQNNIVEDMKCLEECRKK